MKKILLISTILLFVGSCAKPDATEKRMIAVEKSYIMMSSGNCQGAIDVLSAVTSSDTDAKFLQAKSLAYACKAGYSTVKLFGSDIDEFSGAGGFLNAMARFSTSALRDELDDANFTDLQTAIDILLYAGGLSSTQQPSHAKRAQIFDEEELGEIEAQLTYMLMVQLGMYFRYYGNMDASGIKGSGTEINDCLLTYDTPLVQVFMAASPSGSCDNPADVGHEDLVDDSNQAETARACRGIVLFNQLLDVFEGVVSAAGSDLLGGGWTDSIIAAKAALLAEIPGAAILSELNYNDCVTDNVADDTEIEWYFAALFEQSLE